MTITDELRPAIRQAALTIAEGDIVGLCSLKYNHFSVANPKYLTLGNAIRQRITNPTSDAWKQRRHAGQCSEFAVRNLLPLTVQQDDLLDFSWHRLPYETRVVGACRWYRWAIRTCQLADKMLEGVPLALRCNVRVLARRFAEGRPGKCHNASVSVVQCADHVEVSYRLHNTTILRGKKYPGDSNTRLHLLNWGGWLTQTTQRHINNVLSALGLPTVRRSTWANCPRTVSTAGSDYVVHWADYRHRAYEVRGFVLLLDRAGKQPLADLLHWLHRCDRIAVQRMSEYDFSQGDGSVPSVVKAMLGDKRRKVCYIGPTARFLGVTK